MFEIGWQTFRNAGRSGSLLARLTLLMVFLLYSAACSTSPQPTPTPLPTSTPEAAPTPTATATPPTPTPTPTAVASDVIASTLGGLPSIADMVAKVGPAVVSISVVATGIDIFLRPVPEPGAGSGTIIDSNGYVLTNFHVIRGAQDVTVNLADGRNLKATVVGQDPLSDLAIVKIDAQGLPTASFGDSNTLRIGDWVVAMGNALNLKGGPSVTVGVVSARGRTVSTDEGTLYDLIQTDAAINDGSSGGPLLNLKGEVVGINSAILRQAQGIGFAISSNSALPIIKTLREKGRVIRPLIGLTGQDLTPSIASQVGLNTTNGIVIARLLSNGPAEKAGLRNGDVITKLDGIPTPDMGRFLSLLWSYKVGDKAEVEYIRDGRTSSVVVELVERTSRLDSTTFGTRIA